MRGSQPDCSGVRQLRRRVLVAAVIAAGWGSACNKRQMATTAAPADVARAGAAMDGAPNTTGWDVEDYERELTRIEDAMAAEGVAVVRRLSRTAQAAAETQDPGRCGRICELADAICGLEVNICAMAGEHVGEARYADACTRVRQDCARAQEACDACDNE